MLRVHESWREEAGWMLIMLGFAGFWFALINLLAHLGLPDSRSLTMMIMGVAAVVFVLGLALHITRPSRRQIADDQPRQDSKMQHV